MELGSDATTLLGRAAVWAELTTLLDRNLPEPPAPAAARLDRDPGPAGALLVGPAGIGKTTLVERFAATARRLGFPVAQATGVAGAEPYSVLRVLTAGADLDELPTGQRQALRTALTDAAAPVDLLALRAAVCAVFALLAGEFPLVLVVDDVDRVDPPTLDLLLTVTSVLTWRQAPVVALFAARTERVPVELADLLPQVTVTPLDVREAEELLDRVGAPTGSARLEILRRAAGNPLALHEYGTWLEPDDGPTRADGRVEADGGTADVDGGVAEVFARRVRELPEVSRRALTLAAAGERNVAVLSRAEPALTLAAWQPAEEAGLVTISDAMVRFRHPLVEFAVLDAAGAGARRRAHRALAEATADPRRALWHRAEAADGVDPELAAALIAAARPLNGAAAVTAVGLLEQACDLLPPADRAPILLEATARAAAVGRIRWAADIAARARAVLPPGSGLDADLTIVTSWVLSMRGRVNDAAALLTAALTGYNAAARTPPEAPAHGSGTAETPVGLIETGTLPGFLLGEGPLTEALRGAVAGRRQAVLFPRALVRPDEDLRREILAVPEPTTPAEMARAAAAGAGAMLIDEPEHALRLLGPAVKAAIDGTAAAAFLAAPSAACWSLIDTGRWVEAEQWLVPLLSSPVMAEAGMIRGGAQAQLAVIDLGRGREPGAGGRLAGNGPLPAEPALALRVGWARGVAAAAVGEHDEAYGWLSAAAEIRHPWQPLVLPDLITAAGHTGRTAQARATYEKILSAYGDSWLSDRKRSRLAASAALLDPDPARLAAVVDAPGAQRRPFERAVLAVELADRLRRAQQPAKAREVLVSALDTFDRLRAAAWTARVHAELRIAAPPAPSALTAQQEQIVRLAARGLTNREIGERLFLSPRTVGSHLYRLFPQLGVTNRAQLGDLVTTLDRRSASKDSL
ncbi:helix-turn-helix transcriptional regulator [Actinoplanes sp. HUAS TT8]|uniref:helix-turn-helix transcriptional regulator n=1 Tax=Actinoplanes sp. HUAS TT8 TaxID=3447453 RepID=UPI003F51B31E